MNTLEIKNLLGDILPAVDFDADFLFAELDSISVATILYTLSEKYNIFLDAEDVTPRNFRSIESITAMVKDKMSLEGKIHQAAVTTPDKVAVICGKESITYSRLWDAILERAECLKREGLRAHRPYVYRNSQDIGFLITYCAIHCLHAIAVPLGAQVSDEVFNEVKDEVDAYKFEDDIVDTLYTTGTTGKSKGVMLSSTCLEACTDNFITDLKFTSDLLFIVSGPLNHIATLFKIHPTLSVGATVYVIDGLKDMNAFLRIFDLPYKKFATFLVPSSIRMLMQFSYERLCALAPKIDFIETGAAPITGKDMEMLSKALPNTRLYNTYGGSEIGCVATYNFNDGRYMENCIGRPLKNASVEISPDGNMIVSGTMIMSGYVNDPEETAKVIIDGKIHMSDMGYFDDEGMIHLTGRLGDVINVGGYKVNPLEVENAAASFPGVRDCICIEGKHPVIGTVLKLLVVLEDGLELDKHAIALHIKSHLEPYKVPVLYEKVDAVRYTYNGKVDRKSYKE